MIFEDFARVLSLQQSCTHEVDVYPYVTDHAYKEENAGHAVTLRPSGHEACAACGSSTGASPVDTQDQAQKEAWVRKRLLSQDVAG